MKPLRPYQQQLIEALRHSLGTAAARRARLGLPPQPGRVIAQLPTGGGKTRTAAELIMLAWAKASGAFPVVFTVPRIGLITQTSRAFWDEGIRDIGELQGSRKPRPGAMVQVASLQTLPNRAIPRARMVIVDEVHIRSDWLWRQIAPGGAWANVPIIGLSATPWTRGLGKHFDDLVSVVSMAELIEQGALSSYRLRWPGQRPDLSEVKTKRGLDGEMDYNERQLAEVMAAPSLVADAVQTYLAQGEGRPAVCFAVDRAHANMLCEQFQGAGVAAEYADAYAEPEERDAIGDRLRTGATKVFCNVGIATTGIDWPWVSCLIMCRPTQSPMLWVQIAGRVLRRHPQGGDSIILDHTDTSKNLGRPEDIHYESLDGGPQDKSGKAKKRERKTPTLKECPSCKNVKPAGMHKCPTCGFAPMRRSEIEHAEGVLVEAIPARGAEDRDGTPRAERARWYAMLKWWCTSKGYNPAWINHKYAERFGYPPGRDIDRGAQPIVPDDACRGWIRSRQIAYAKGMQKAAARKGRAA